MKTALRNNTTIQTGVFVKPIPKGEIVYFQAKHIDENGELTNMLYPDLKYDGKIEKHLLETVGVLFAAKVFLIIFKILPMDMKMIKTGL